MMQTMELLRSPLFATCLWAIAAIATVWILGPAVGVALGIGEYKTEVEDDPHAAQPRGKDPVYERKYRQLTEVGFVPLGRTVETKWFLTPLHWHWRSNGSRWLTSPDRKTLVSLGRVAGANPLRVRANAFVEGGIVQVVAPAVGVEHDNGVDLRDEIEDDVEPAKLLARHRQVLETFLAENGRTVQALTLHEAAEAMLAYNRRNVSRGKLAGSYVILAIFVLPLLETFVSPRVSSNWVRPGLICLMAAVFAFLRWAILPNRIPRSIRMGVLAIGMMAFTLGLPRLLMRVRPNQWLLRAVDRIAADVQPPPSPAEIDRIVAKGAPACTLLVRRFADPVTSPNGRRSLHAILVRLKGSDVGDAPNPWKTWCTEVMSPGPNPQASK
jgi:hypothetical protein